MSQLTREVMKRKFRTTQAMTRIIHKLVDEIEALERKLEKRPILLPNFGRVHVSREDTVALPAVSEGQPPPNIKKSYYKEKKDEKENLG